MPTPCGWVNNLQLQHLYTQRTIRKCTNVDQLRASLHGAPPVVLCVPFCLYTALEGKVLRYKLICVWYFQLESLLFFPHYFLSSLCGDKLAKTDHKGVVMAKEIKHANNKALLPLHLIYFSCPTHVLLLCELL